MEWFNRLVNGMGMLGAAPQQPGGVIARPQPLPQNTTFNQPSTNRFLNDPAMGSALLRMGAGILKANSQGAGFGGSVGVGLGEFEAGLRDGRTAALNERVQAAEIAKAEREARFGVRSAGFEGDIARAVVVMNNPASTEDERRVAQSIIQTAQRLQGSYDPVSGVYRMNQRAAIPGVGEMPAPAAAPRAPLNPQITSENILPAPGGEPVNLPIEMRRPSSALLPPVDSSFKGEPMPMDMAGPQIDFTPTGNPKVDAALRQKQAELQMEQSVKSQEGQNERVRDLPVAIDNATRALENIDALLADPDLGSVSGGLFGLQGQQASRVPLTEAQRRLQPRIESLKGDTFLQAYQTLRGGGQITEVEGKKAEAAIARIGAQYTPDSEYRQALLDLRDVVMKALERSRNSANMSTGQIKESATARANQVLSGQGQAPQNMRDMSDDELKRMLGL